jgi:hypothetical protein
VNSKAVISLVTLVSVASVAVVVWMLRATNPSQVGPFGVTLWFVAVLAGLSGILTLVFFGLRRRFKPMDVETKQLGASWRDGFLFAIALTSLLALQSLRQLSWRDLILIVILTGLVEFYFRTRR